MTHILDDMTPLQALRTDVPAFGRALAADQRDPAPFGSTALADAGSHAPQSHTDAFALSMNGLRSIDGGLPDYLLEEMFRRLNAGDRSLYDFLGMFDRRLTDLKLAVERQAILVAEQDAGASGPGLLPLIARLSGGRTSALSLIPELLSKSRGLDGLRRALSWWTRREVRVSADFDRPTPVDESCRTTLGSQSAALGRGTLLGKFGHTAQGRIEIEVLCPDRASFETLLADDRMIEGFWQILQAILRDPAPFSVYAVIPREAIGAPKLSAHRGQGTRLGQYNCLGLSRPQGKTTRIKLTNSAAAA
ncbi:type VI secretion system baseplate subunit TssG [Donghicola mangrovi]|uniref:Type VI secretion system baseplate subunit TssG n=1 Tax=Donghicola mangrovi TaxID=2729614 RepID=A0A850QAR2_9RHOB|nr:type VI secretion system baseplate subunit TssG [Donghicola mangrovi]NVO23021.1 type VI secretion system baseplate subunit TssG [Donghicola mangrovi]